MSTKEVITAKSSFIQAIKEELAAKKNRHAELFSQIKQGTVEKLKKMNA